MTHAHILTRNTWDSLKNWLKIDIWNEVGLFQLGIGSTFVHVFLDTNSINEALSLGLLYCLNIPLFTLENKN